MTKDEALALAATVVKTYNPDLDVSPHSPLYEMVLVPSAELISKSNGDFSSIQQMIQGVLTGNVSSGEALDIAGRLFMVTRSQGTPSTGTITLNFSNSAKDISVPAVDITPENTTFAVSGVQFIPTISYRVGGTDLLSGSLNIPVMCSFAGYSGNIATTASVEITGPISTYVQSAYLNGGAHGGRDTESDDSLRERIQNAAFPSSALTQESLNLAIRSEVPQITDTAVVSSPDDEMLRDIFQLNGTAVHAGGRVDLYVKPSDINIQTSVLPTYLEGAIPFSDLVSSDRYVLTSNGTLSMNGAFSYLDEPGGPGTAFTEKDFYTGTYIPTLGYVCNLSNLGPILGVLSVTSGNNVLKEGTDYLVVSGDRATSFSSQNKVFIIFASKPSSQVSVSYVSAPCLTEAQKYADTIVVADVLAKAFSPAFVSLSGMALIPPGVDLERDVRSVFAQTPNASMNTLLNIMSKVGIMFKSQITYTTTLVFPTGKSVKKVLTQASDPVASVNDVPQPEFFRMYLLPNALDNLVNLKG